MRKLMLLALVVSLAFVSAGRGADKADKKVDKKTEPKAGEGKTVEQLLKELKEGKGAEQRLAAVHLGGMGEKAAKAVPALATALREGDDKLRWTSALSLASLGPTASGCHVSIDRRAR